MPAVFFRTTAGNEPVRDWLKRDLTHDERTAVGEDILTVQYRWPLGMPLVDSIGHGISEVRTRLPTRIARTLFFAHAGTIILLHGFIKKTRTTPNDDKALALARKNEYITQSEKKPASRK